MEPSQGFNRGVNRQQITNRPELRFASNNMQASQAEEIDHDFKVLASFLAEEHNGNSGGELSKVSNGSSGPRAGRPQFRFGGEKRSRCRQEL